MIAKVASIAAVVLSVAALAVAVTHQGPRGLDGPRGPQGTAGNPGRSAQTSRFGICWSAPVFTYDAGAGSSYNWVSSVSIDAPVLSNGVFTCPQGDTFTSIVPQPAPSGG